MSKYLTQFVPGMATVTSAFRELLFQHMEFQTVAIHKSPLSNLKAFLITVLNYYNTIKTMVVLRDVEASSLGALLPKEGFLKTCKSKVMVTAQQKSISYCFGYTRFQQHITEKKV